MLNPISEFGQGFAAQSAEFLGISSHPNGSSAAFELGGIASGLTVGAPLAFAGTAVHETSQLAQVLTNSQASFGPAITNNGSLAIPGTGSSSGGGLLGAIRQGVAEGDRIIGVDAYAGLVGQFGEAFTFGEDLASVGSSLRHGDLVGAGRGVGGTLFDLTIPNYGLYGGAGWGTRQFGKSGRILPLNQQDWANLLHDNSRHNFGWIRHSYHPSSVPGLSKALPAGPIGQAYKLVGTIPFAVSGLFQKK